MSCREVFDVLTRSGYPVVPVPVVTRSIKIVLRIPSSSTVRVFSMMCRIRNELRAYDFPLSYSSVLLSVVTVTNVV